MASASLWLILQSPPRGSSTGAGTRCRRRAGPSRAAPPRAGYRRPRLRPSGPPRLPERERVSLGAGLEECDLQRALANRVALAHELVQAAFPEQAVPVLVDVRAV